MRAIVNTEQCTTYASPIIAMKFLTNANLCLICGFKKGFRMGLETFPGSILDIFYSDVCSTIWHSWFARAVVFR